MLTLFDQTYQRVCYLRSQFVAIEIEGLQRAFSIFSDFGNENISQFIA